MSLYLPDQKLGSHSQPGSSSHKFVVKGRQTGSMHRGHTWVFRAESYDTMMAWYDDIKTLTEKTGEERNAFVRRHHARSLSQSSTRSGSSDGGLEEDEADRVPFSANHSIMNESVKEDPPVRPSPGGRFPSDIQSSRSLQAPLSPNSSGSSDVGLDITSASGGLQAAHQYPSEPTNHDTFPPQQQSQVPYTSQIAYADGYNPDYAYQQQTPTQEKGAFFSNPAPTNYQTQQNEYQPTPTNYQPAPTNYQPPPQNTYQPAPPQNTYQPQPTQAAPMQELDRHDSNYGNWMAPAAGGAAAGALGAAAYNRHQANREQEIEQHPPMNQISEGSPAGNPPSAIPVAVAGGHPAIPLPMHEPIHTTTTTTSHIPVLAAAPQSVVSEGDSLATTPATQHESFLGGVEPVPAAVSTNTSNGGPSTTEGAQSFPRVQRSNTDFSVSDLHVPGEYPRIPGV
jgi:hypothetical protein